MKKYFPLRSSKLFEHLFVKTVDDLTFDIPKGMAFSVVGESGSGKATLGRTVLRLIEPTSGKLFMKETS